jgi:cyclophilin family peptidyl-prolyl cis-trans isomerase
VIPNFMIQGGGFEKSMKEKPTRPPIENEAKNGLKNDLGTLAMARTNQPHSASAQFFINTKNNDFLNYPGQDGWGYAVFGKVVSGMDVVMKISGVATGNAGMFQDVPREPVVIESATLVADKK